MALVAFDQLFGDELAFGARDDLGEEAAARLIEQFLIAPDIAAFQQGGADGDVRFGHADHIVEAAAGMADLQPQIPQEIEHRLDHLLAPVGLLGGGEEGDVDIGMRRHLAAPIAAHGHDRQPLAAGAVPGGVDIVDDVIVDDAQQLVDQKGLSRRRIMTGCRAFFQAAGDFLTAMGQRGAQRFDHLHPLAGGRLGGHLGGDGGG